MTFKIYLAIVMASALGGCGRNQPPAEPKVHSYVVHVWLLNVDGTHVAEQNQKIPPSIYGVIGGLSFLGSCEITLMKSTTSQDIYGMGGGKNSFKGEAISCTAHQYQPSGFGIEMSITREDGTLVGNSRSIDPLGTVKVAGT